MTEPDHETEHRLRAALRARADRIEPSPDGLDRIEEALMAEEPTARTDDPTAASTTRNRWIGGGAVAAVVLLVVIGLVVTGDDDDEGVVADATTSSTETTTTTTEATTTTTTEPFASEVDPFGVAFPGPGTSQRFESPEAAAQAYATQVLGFTELESGPYLEGDSRSGEIEIRDRPEGPATVVLVRQMEDDTWYVLATIAADVTVDTPTAGDTIGASFETTGSAVAFEGTVEVLVRAQTDPMPLGEGFVTGSGVPPAAPFAGTIELDAPPQEETPGIAIYRTLSAEDGHVIQATSFPVRIAAG